MTKTQSRAIAFTILFISILLTPTHAKGRSVLVSCKVDGESKPVNYRIKLYTKQMEIEPRYVKNGFIMSDKLQDESIGVKVIVEGKEIDFGQANKELFETEWVIGIDNKPYEKANVGHLPEEMRDKGEVIYYIEFKSEGLIKNKKTVFK